MRVRKKNPATGHWHSREARMADDVQQHSKWQDFRDKTLPVIAGGIIAGIFAIAGSYLATTFQTSAQVQLQKAEERRKVFASLMGQKIMCEQLNISKANADITFYYYEDRWNRAGSPNTSVDLEEASIGRIIATILLWRQQKVVKQFLKM
jgi:hypothetical protein